MSYVLIPRLTEEITIPEKGILSHVVEKNDRLNITLFGFAAGQSLAAHSAPTPAMVQIIEGRARVQLGDDLVTMEAGAWVLMPPQLEHGIEAVSDVKLLLIQVKAAPAQG